MLVAKTVLESVPAELVQGSGPGVTGLQPVVPLPLACLM